MSSPLTILLADDQVPWHTNAENDRTKAEIRREFAVVKPDLDVDAAFSDDYAWFTGLLAYLEHTKGEMVCIARGVVERDVSPAEPARQLSASGVQVYDSRAPA